MNFDLPMNSRGLALLIQYVPSTNVQQFKNRAHSYSDLMTFALSDDYVQLATYLNMDKPRNMTSQQFIAQQLQPIVQMSTLKHLPGKHDQRTHGRRGRAGTAFANTYVSARQDGKTHHQLS